MSSRIWNAALVIALLELGAGVVAYVLAFLIAYGFEDDITTRNHGVFVVLIVIIAGLSWLVAWPIASSLSGLSRRSAALFAAGLTALLHGLALAVGTLVSGANEDQNSVTAGWAGMTYVVVVGVALLVALAGAAGFGAALRSFRGSGSARSGMP